MTVDLENMSRKDLEKLASDIEKTLKKRAKNELKAARFAAEKAASEHGFSLSEILADAPMSGKGSRGKVAPKYANPEDPSQKWTGRGRKPLWAAAALESGKTLEDLLI